MKAEVHCFAVWLLLPSDVRRLQLDFVASKMLACLENCASLCRGFKKQRLPWRGPFDLEKNCDVPGVAQRAGGLPLSKGMRATRVCSEQRTDLYEIWHNREGVLKPR
jgi:hypothetical protein